jgi:hypothetical protein
MNRTVMAALAAVGALAGLTLTACGSSAPDYQSNAAVACQLLATGTSVTGLTGGYDTLSAAEIAIQKQAGGQQATSIGGPAADQLTPAFTRDVLAVTSTGLNSPSAAQVDQLQGDCAALGVPARIWPSQLTGNGS